MAEGIDFSWARPGGASIKAAGKEFVVRYLYPGGGKGCTRAELDDYTAHGLALAFVYEETGQELNGGFASGLRVAHAAEVQRMALGLPPTTPIYFAVDFNAAGQALANCVAAIDGAVSVLGHDRVGGYGGIAFIDAIAGHCKYGWQTYAWSAGRVSSNAQLYQYSNGHTINGGGVDFCRNLAADFGAINGATLSPSAPASSGGAALAKNTSGHSNAEVQEQLNRYGYNLLVDGIFGPNTTAAVVDFQSKHGLTVDRIVGPATWAALVGGVANPGKLVVDGEWGSLTTKAEQHALGVTADGIRGKNTIAAEQHRTGAKVDGIDGPDTRKHLQKYLGVTQDGKIGSVTVKALQTRLNAGTF